MERYHKKVYFPDNSLQVLSDFTNKINALAWNVTAHSIERIKEHLQLWTLETLMERIKGLVLTIGYVFEYYEEEQEITKVCYRIPYNKTSDLILVIGYDKKLITCYFNLRDDEHFTLKKELYNKED